VAWIDISDRREDILETVKQHTFSRFPVCDGTLDHVIGIVHVRDLLISAVATGSFEVRTMIREPLFVPEGCEMWEVVELFRTSHIEMAFVADEHGHVEGLITITDVLAPILEGLRYEGRI
jgi:putative hemolysin